MAGRGRGFPLSGYEGRLHPQRRPGAVSTQSNSGLNDLIKKIELLNMENLSKSAINEVETVFKQLCTNKEILTDTLTSLHGKCLKDCEFSYKFISSFENLFNIDIDDTSVRSVLLKNVQNDFLQREDLHFKDINKFVNAVLLLGYIFHFVKVQGEPIAILSAALFDYLNLILTKGDEFEFQVFTTQIFLNGSYLKSQDEKRFSILLTSIRNALLIRHLSSHSRCWLLLAIDYASNDLKPLTGTLREFYLSKLSEDLLELESMVENASVESIKKPISLMKVSNSKNNSQGASEKKFDKFKETVSDIDNIPERMRQKGLKPNKKPEDSRKNRNWREGERLSDDDKIWGLGDKNRGKVNFHDDRFDKDEEFYGIQLPRNK